MCLLPSIKLKRYSYITILINIYSFLKLIPYFLVWDPVDETFTLHTSKFQQVFSVSLQIISIYTSLYWVVEPLKQLQEGKQQQHNLILLFDVVEHAVAFMLCLYMVNILWKRKESTMKLINETYPFTVNTSNSQYIIVFSLFLIHVVGYRILGAPFDSAKTRAEAAVQFFHKILQDFAIVPASVKSFIIHGMSYPLKYLLVLILLLNSGFYVFPHVLIICILLTLRQVWKVHQVLFLQLGVSFEMGVSLYCAMKHHLSQVNALITTPMLLIYLTNLTYFAKIPDILSHKFFHDISSIVDKINMLFYCMYTAIIWTVASQIHAEIQGAMKIWVYEFHTNRKRMISLEDRMKLISLMHQVEYENIGVSCQFFTVTYNTFGSMFGLIVTYALVVYSLPK